MNDILIQAKRAGNKNNELDNKGVISFRIAKKRPEEKDQKLLEEYAKYSFYARGRLKK